MKSATVGIAMAGALVLAPRPAPACGPTYDPSSNDPPCLFVQLWSPAPTFPNQLEAALRIGTFDRSGNILSPHDAFDPDVQVFVHRAVAGGGYEPVAFQLVSQAGLVPNALHLQLADPAPGQYIVSSPQMTCAADPSPTGTGLVVGTFELEPEAPLPTALGSLHWVGEQSADETVSVGPDGACRITDVTVAVTHSKLALQLDAAALPWAGTLEHAIYVDGALYRGFGPLPSSDGVATIDLTRICSSSDPTLVKPDAGVGDGMHTIKLVGRIEGLAMIESNETTFSLGCDDGWLGVGGCAVDDDGHSSAWPLLAIGGLIAMRRRRRTRAARG